MMIFFCKGSIYQLSFSGTVDPEERRALFYIGALLNSKFEIYNYSTACNRV